MLSRSPIAKSIALYTYVFNMPMFFMLAGYFLNISKYSFYFDYFKNLFKKIMIPYIWFSVFSIIFYVFYYKMPYYDHYTLLNMLKVFILATRNTIFYNVPLWFLPTLFFVANIFYFIKKINRKLIELLLLLLAGSFFVIIWNTIYNPKLPWTIDSGFYYLMFVALGYYIKNNNLLKIFKNNLLKIFVFILALSINTLTIWSPQLYKFIFNGDFYNKYRFGYFLISLVFALAGIYVIMIISKIFKRNLALEYLGRNSLTYFALHVPFFLIFNKAIRQIFNLESNLVLLSLIYLFLTIVLLIPINWLIENKARWILGK